MLGRLTRPTCEYGLQSLPTIMDRTELITNIAKQ